MTGRDPNRRATLVVRGTGETVDFEPARLVVAGYTGRDEASVRRHIAELAELGVPPPARVPAFYPVDLDRLTFGDEIAVDGAETSGEVEPVLYCTASGWYVGVGSDHTDRRLERRSIELSKQACPKVASVDVLPLERVEDAWEDLRLRSFVDDGAPYQDAPLSELMPVREILGRLLDGDSAEPRGLVLFLGTVPIAGGTFRFAGSYRCEIVTHGGEVLLRHGYRLRRRPS